MSQLATEITEWAKGLHGWQRHVLQQLANDKTLSYLEHQSIAEALISGERYELVEFAIPASLTPSRAGPRVDLLEICATENINAIMPSQTLRFRNNGLTVVYGDNGSGKSGYARIIKKVSGARHQEDILSNVFTQEHSTEVNALLRVAIDDNEPEAHTWPTSDSTDLKQINFFDHACGRKYIVTDTDVTYRPSEMLLIDGLIAACDDIKGCLGQKLAKIDQPLLPADFVSPGSEAGLYISNLSGVTSEDDISAIWHFGPEDEQLLHEIRVAESRLNSSNPNSERQRLGTLVGDLRTIAAHLTDLQSKLGVDAQSSLEEIRATAISSRTAANVAAQSRFGDASIPGVGSESWRRLWEAARDYSTTTAYVDEVFPKVDDGAKCVLCHQDLNEDASRRLASFEEYIIDRTEQEAQLAEAQLTAKLTEVQDTVPRTGDIAQILERLREYNTQLIEGCDAVIQEFELIRSSLINSEEVQSEAECTDLISRLQQLSKSEDAKMGALDDETFALDLKNTTKEKTVLEERKKMAEHVSELFAEAQRLQEHALISVLIQGTDTTQITKKATELTKSYALQHIQGIFQAEMQKLGLVQVEFANAGGAKGKLRQRPALKDVKQAANVPDVLSEGELTTLGLVGFFTEIELDKSNSSIVLDDPISSLDHAHRQAVAKRLVEFAANRQVIVFTHDAPFLRDLQREATLSKVDYNAVHIERRNEHTGFCNAELPWKAKAINVRLEELVTMLAQTKRVFEDSSTTGDQRMTMVSQWAGHMSETLERMLRSDILRPTTDQSSGEVRPKMLKVLVQVDTKDNEDFQKYYNKISEWTLRHDIDLEANPTIPNLDEIDTLLTDVKEWWKRIQTYRNVS